MLVRRKSHWRGTINTVRCGRLDTEREDRVFAVTVHPSPPPPPLLLLSTLVPLRHTAARASQRSFSANLLEALILTRPWKKRDLRGHERAATTYTMLQYISGRYVEATLPLDDLLSHLNSICCPPPPPPARHRPAAVNHKFWTRLGPFYFHYTTVDTFATKIIFHLTAIKTSDVGCLVRPVDRRVSEEGWNPTCGSLRSCVINHFDYKSRHVPANFNSTFR